MICEFISHVTFVIDEREPTEYVKSIIKMHPHLIPEDTILEAIFNEIRDKQSSKKNIKYCRGNYYRSDRRSIRLLSTFD